MKRLPVYLAVLIVGFLLGYLFGRRVEAPVDPGPAVDLGAAGARDEPSDRKDDAAARGDEPARRREPAREPAREPDAATGVRVVGKLADAEGAELRVRVRSSAHEPLPGLEVEVVRHVPPVGRSTGRTDAAGLAVFGDLKPGPVNVGIRAADSYRDGTVNLATGAVTEMVVEIPAGGVAVSGVVRDVRDGGRPGVVVSLLRTDAELRDRYQTRSDATGAFRFASIPPGTYNLSAQIGAGAGARHPYRAIAVPESGEVRQDLVVGVRSLFGEVRDAQTGRRIETFTVRVGRANDWRTMEVDAGGEFEFLDLSAGAYAMTASAPGHVVVSRRSPEVREGESTRVDIELEPAATLLLTVIGRDGVPVTGPVTLGFRSLEGRRGSPANAVAGEGGLLRHDRTAPGRWAITVEAKGAGRAAIEATLAAGENRLEVRLE